MIGQLLPSLALTAFCFAPAYAGFILQPVAVSTTTPTTFGDPGNLINQSGLSIPYTSLVTDFDTYIASNPTHGNFLTDNNTFWGMGFNAFPTPSRSVDFDLGGTFTIQSFAIWQSSGLQASVRNFELFADDNADFTSPLLLGSFEASDNSGTITDSSAQVFSFSAAEASHVRLLVNSVSSLNLNDPRLGEVAFEVKAVPEPSTLFMVSVGAVGLLIPRWQRRLSSSI